MNWHDRLPDEDDPELKRALSNFKASVDAWSENAMLRPRTAMKPVRHAWRLAAGWALGCAVVATTVSGALYERQHRQELARLAAARTSAEKAAQQRAMSIETDQDLLANVDSDISRAVPAAMEPLAQMMDTDQAENDATKHGTK